MDGEQNEKSKRFAIDDTNNSPRVWVLERDVCVEIRSALDMYSLWGECSILAGMEAEKACGWEFPIIDLEQFSDALNWLAENDYEQIEYEEMLKNIVDRAVI